MAKDELAVLSAQATQGVWSIWREPIHNAADAIAELTAQVDATEPMIDAVVLLGAGGKCPAITGCGPTSDANAAFITALVNAYRASELVPAAALAEAVAALLQARNDLLEVGNDYPGSSCQQWCAERAANAWNALKPWRHCPSTHCERAQECRSVNECSAEKSTTRAALTPTTDEAQ